MQRCPEDEKITVERGELTEPGTVVLLSRVRSGRSIHVSQFPGDLVLRLFESSIVVEAMLCGRRYRLALTPKAGRANFVARDTSYDDIECVKCGLRLGCTGHLESH